MNYEKESYNNLSNFLNDRFPIPDLRPASQVDRFPWWQKNLREEMVILKLNDFRFITSIKSQQSVLQLDIICKDVHGM